MLKLTLGRRNPTHSLWENAFQQTPKVEKNLVIQIEVRILGEKVKERSEIPQMCVLDSKYS